MMVRWGRRLRLDGRFEGAQKCKEQKSRSAMTEFVVSYIT
ncbi:MAG: hypothetical protein K0R98_2004 [Rickettsiaceae bacterium]|nr:hypothetical protein [Rickettsiaceae bacterium]